MSEQESTYWASYPVLYQSLTEPRLVTATVSTARLLLLLYNHCRSGKAHTLLTTAHHCSHCCSGKIRRSEKRERERRVCRSSRVPSDVSSTLCRAKNALASEFACRVCLAVLTLHCVCVLVLHCLVVPAGLMLLDGRVPSSSRTAVAVQQQQQQYSSRLRL